MDKSELYAKSEKMKELLGAEELVDALEMVLDRDTLQKTLEYIDRCHELNVFNKED